MSRYRKGRRRAALLGITAGCVGAAVFLGVSVKLYRERKDTEAMIESRHATWEQNTAGESSDPPEAAPDPEKMLSEAARFLEWKGVPAQYLYEGSPLYGGGPGKYHDRR